MRLLVGPAQPRRPGQALDFRDEIMAQIYDRGDAAPKRALIFHIEAGRGSTHGPEFFQRRRFGNWVRIGRLIFNEAVASYNGDFVIHFNHPTRRDDRNDPTAMTDPCEARGVVRPARRPGRRSRQELPHTCRSQSPSGSAQLGQRRLSCASAKRRLHPSKPTSCPVESKHLFSANCRHLANLA
jgi:hypothetical protein